MADRTVKGTAIVADTCFLSLQTIANRALCSPSTARRAITDLIEAGLYTKSPLPGRQLQGRPSESGRFDGVRYSLTPIWDTIPLPWDKAKREKAARNSKVAQCEEDKAKAASLPNSEPSGTDSEEWREVYDYLADVYAEHPTMREPNVEKLLQPTIEHCLAQAGTAYLVLRMGELRFL